METARDTAQRVVDRLLGEETAKPAPKTEERPKLEARPLLNRTSGPARPLPEASMGVKKAWKKGKSMSGSSVAKKPGKVSYREALQRQALANIAARKIEEKKMGSGMKGNKAKKVSTVAKKPGAVGYGKR